MDNLDRINEILQCVGRIWSESPVDNEDVRDDLHTIVDNIQIIKAELLELWSQKDDQRDVDVSLREALQRIKYECSTKAHCEDCALYWICPFLRTAIQPPSNWDVTAIVRGCGSRVYEEREDGGAE